MGPVAGLPTETSEQFQDLLLAELSDRPRFALIERGELNRILAEAELSLSQLGEPANAVRAGRLLNADWLLLMKRVSSGRSLLLARIVDTRSGVIRDITAFDSDPADMAGMVTDVAGFLVNSSFKSGATPVRQFLALGGFQDLSVNPRHPELPMQLKAQLALACREHGYILVEREVVDLLLQEARLNLGGLVEDTGPLPVMQGAFWLVDGYYQAFVDDDLRMDLVIRVQRVRGSHTLHRLSGVAGESLYAQAWETIRAALARPDPFIARPTRQHEFRLQMDKGKELAELQNDITLDQRLVALDSYGGVSSRWMNDREAWRQRLLTAIEAFESASLLDPTSHEATLCLAVCLADPMIGRRDEARNLIEEIIATPDPGAKSDRARLALAYSYRHENPIRARALFERYAAEATSENMRNACLSGLELLESTTPRSRDSGSKLAAAETGIAKSLERVHAWFQAGKGIEPSWFRIVDITVALRPDREAALARYAALVPQWCEQYPELAPYLLILWTAEQTSTNSVAEQQLRKSLAAIEADPSLLNDARSYVGELYTLISWSLGMRVGDLAVRACQLRARLAEQGLCDPLNERDRIMLAYGYRDLENWERALELVEPFGYRAVTMGLGGPWGAYPVPDLPVRSALIYREKLGRSTIDPKIMFASGQVVNGRSVSDFVTDGNQCWVSFSNRLARLDQNSGEKIEIELPGRGEAIPKCLAQGADTVWIGTREAGVIAVDSQTLATRQWTESDGLLINHIQSMLLEADSLWIGYGQGYQGAGGFGRMDLKTGKIRNWIPALPAGVGRSESVGHEATSIVDPPDGPPRNRVVGIARGGPHTLWIAVARKGLQKFDTKTETWTTLDSSDQENRLVCLAANAEVMVAGCEGRLGAADTQPGNGGLTIVRAGEDQPRYLHVPDGLPHPTVTAVALHDEVAWIGGTGFVGILDLATLEFRRICPARTVRVTRIAVNEQGAWVATDGGIERFTRDDIAAARGTAKTTVQ